MRLANYILEKVAKRKIPARVGPEVSTVFVDWLEILVNLGHIFPSLDFFWSDPEYPFDVYKWSRFSFDFDSLQPDLDTKQPAWKFIFHLQWKYLKLEKEKLE